MSREHVKAGGERGLDHFFPEDAPSQLVTVMIVVQLPRFVERHFAHPL